MSDIRNNERAKQFLSKQAYMVIAVVLPDGSPWAVPVKIQSHEENEFEWDSKLDTVHSQALESNPQASITIFEKSGDVQFGFYAKGTVTKVSEADDGLGRYRFMAKQAWTNDESFTKREVTLDRVGL